MTAAQLVEHMQQNGGHTSPTHALVGAGGQYSAEYLSQLLKDKKQLAAFPNVFLHLERLIDEEISKVRVALFQFEFSKEPIPLPEPSGSVATVQEKVYVPVKDYPDYNFVGRILGPRGMTAKQLEQETGCKIMVRGKGSMRDKKKEDANKGKPNWEHLAEDLHVLIQCEDTENRAKVKLQRAKDEIRKLLVPAPEGEDELKRKQLMELAIINGTYRPATQSAAQQLHNGTKGLPLQSPRMLTPMSLTGASPLRSPTLGAPIILSPSRHQQQLNAASGLSGLGGTFNFQAALQLAAAQQQQSPVVSSADMSAAMAASAPLLLGGLDAAQWAAAYNPYLAPFLSAVSSAPPTATAGTDYAQLDQTVADMAHWRARLSHY